ncbi:hypothetical protein EXE30_14025 [Acinetobacter halotolerans]|uniref:Uncharacterized protein n=1 Tax=Acinetobacter halotolerans TaxID=1752076 RepID=A0A4Q6X8C9_9GAMM|nr:hypothetical protein [Acinetobacter halotolerans]RZF49861.1 hypothetical protein EXE30_14025 [Acinetobacter halotolerans]
MKESMSNDVLVKAEAFAIATQMYVRLRRVSSRVIDVMYLVSNKEYAQHIVDIALATKDSELERYVARLSPLIDLYPEPKAAVIAAQKGRLENEQVDASDVYSNEVTAEEIYEAQVSHHYIGALR